MKLTAYTDYALRVLMHVALKDGELVRVADVAKSFDISRNHLTKVVHNLGARGYLSTVQGRNGGIRLACVAAEINVGQVVRDFEPDSALVECFDSALSGCRIQTVCVLKQVLKDAESAFMRHLNQVTLADLVQPRRRLQNLLGLPATRSAQGA
ncbi:MAG TPA: Rrf2 family transcriptional regulator [Woeseiaceae bacterium]|nr:Rrf2 family transcriptional regulator [Woeseiaceae bacterium]